MHIFSIFFSIYYDPNIKFLQRTQKFNLKNSRFWWILGHKRDKNGQTLYFVKNNNLVYHLIENFMLINVCKGFFCENQYFVQKWPLFVVFFSRKRGQNGKNSNTGVFLWICKVFKKTYFEKHLRTSASPNKSGSPEIPNGQS